MGLRELAAVHARSILGDEYGFTWPISVTDPEGKTAALKGFSNDVHRGIDPQTGLPISDRIASIAVSMAALVAAGLELPKGVSHESEKPWIVSFDDINGHSHTFKVREAEPDRGLGIVTCRLEAFEA